MGEIPNNNNTSKTYKDTNSQIDIPSHLNKILTDLEKNYKSLTINYENRWVYWDQHNFEKFLPIILTNYEGYNKRYIEEYLYRIRKNPVPLDYIVKNYIYYTPNESGSETPVEENGTSTSTPEKTKKISKSEGEKGHSPHSPMKMGRRGFTEADLREVEESPLIDIENLIEKPQREMGIVIHPEKNIHGLRLMYLFGSNEGRLVPPEERGGTDKSGAQLQRESELFAKMVHYFKPFYENKSGEHDFGKRGWMWPTLYIDVGRQIKAHFSLQMHRKGRIIIPIDRDLNLYEFGQELYSVFKPFLSFDEIKYLFELLFVQGGKENKYLHEAHAVDPDDVVEKRLKGATIHIERFGLDGHSYEKYYVDRSRDYTELEGEGDAQKVQDMFDLIVTPAKVTGSLGQMTSQLKALNRYNTYTLRNQDKTDNKIRWGAAMLTTVLEKQRGQCKLLKSIDERMVTEFGMLDLYLQNTDKLKLDLLKNLKNNIDHLSRGIIDLGYGFHDGIDLLYTFVDKGFRHISEVSREETDILLGVVNDQARELTQDITIAKEDIIDSQRKETDLIVSMINEEMEKVRDDFDDLKGLVMDKIDSSHQDYKDRLYRVLKVILQLPSYTSREIARHIEREFMISKTTIYGYFRKLQEEGLIKSKPHNDGKRGRPPRLFSLTERVKSFLKKRKQ